MTVIAITSGKGGVGKTTIAVNVAVLLSSIGKTLLIDSDIVLPNVHIHLGMDHPFISLLDVLKDNEYLDNSIYNINFILNNKNIVLHVLPSATSIRTLEEIDINKLSEIIKVLKDNYDYIIVDVAAGLSKFAVVPLLSADEVYVVVNPEKASIADAHKVCKIASIIGNKVRGIIINRYKGEKNFVELAQKQVHPNLAGIIRESKLVKKAWEIGKPFVIAYPSSAISKDVAKLAKNIAGMKTEIKKYGKLKYLLGLA